MDPSNFQYVIETVKSLTAEGTRERTLREELEKKVVRLEKEIEMLKAKVEALEAAARTVNNISGSVTNYGTMTGDIK